MNPKSRNLRNYVSAAALVLAALAFTRLIWPIMHPTTFGLVGLAVAASAWFFGKRAGLLSAILSIVLIEYFFVGPRNILRFELGGVVLIVIYGFTALMLSWAGHSRREALNRAQREAEQLRQVQERLAESEQRWRTLTESVPALVWSADAEGACEFASGQWQKYTGAPVEKYMGFQWITFLHEDDRERVCSDWKEAIRKGDAYESQARLRGRDGQYRWFKSRAVPVRSEDGNVISWIGICTDVDDLHEPLERRFETTVERA